MPVTVRNTDILFNDGTAQNTAASAPTTATVLAATAGASVGAVGTYAFLGDIRVSIPSGQNIEGNTVAGSNLRYSNRNGVIGGTPAGTWRAMGRPGGSQSDGYAGVSSVTPTVYLRIS